MREARAHGCAVTKQGSAASVIYSWRTVRRRKRGVTLILAVTLGVLAMAATALAVTGQLTQLSGTAGCVSDTGSSGACTDGKSLLSARAVAVSPDGTSVYVAAYNSMAVFRRDVTNGRLTQLPGTAGCVSRGGSGGACTVARGFKGPTSIASSPDGKNVYLTAGISDSLVVFKRNTTSGALTQLAGTAGCMSQTEGSCTPVTALQGASSVALSPDGKSVYVAANQSNAVAAFRRDTATGALTQLAGVDGCIKEVSAACRPGRVLDGANSVAVSADGTSVYVASQLSDAVAALRRNTTTGTVFQPPGIGGCVSETGDGGSCVDAKALQGAYSVVVSPDRKNIYVASFDSDAVAAFTRDLGSGELYRLPGTLACVSENGSGGQCADGKALNGAVSVAVSKDARSVYVASYLTDAVSAFTRNTTNGTLTQLAGTAGCTSETGTNGRCVNGKALSQPMSVALSAGGRSLYVASILSNAVAVFARQPPP